MAPQCWNKYEFNTCYNLYVIKCFWWLKNILVISNIRQHSYMFSVFCNAVFFTLVEKYHTNSSEEPHFFLSSSSLQYFYSEAGGKHHIFQTIGTYPYTIPHTNILQKTARPVLSAMKSSSLKQQSFNYTSVSFTTAFISNDTVFCTPKLCCR